jgi:GT2 family glycosyltransferase
VQAVEAEVVALSDDDSWWAPGALARAAQLLAARPTLGLIQARVLVGSAERFDPACAAMQESPLPAAPGLPGPALLGFMACGAVVRRSAFLAVGGFHPRLDIGGEETLLAFDLASRGWELAYVDSVVAHHHPDSGSERVGRRARLIRNALWTVWLRRRLPAAATTTARLAESAVRQRRIRVLAEAARGLPWVLAERRPLPLALDRAADLVY